MKEVIYKSGSVRKPLLIDTDNLSVLLNAMDGHTTKIRKINSFVIVYTNRKNGEVRYIIDLRNI